MKISSYTEIFKIDTMAEHETHGFEILFKEYSDAGLIMTMTNKVTSESKEISVKGLWELLKKEKK